MRDRKRVASNLRVVVADDDYVLEGVRERSAPQNPLAEVGPTRLTDERDALGLQFASRRGGVVPVRRVGSEL